MPLGSHKGRRASPASPGLDFSSIQPDFFQRLERQPELCGRAPTAADLDLGPELLGAINTAIREARSHGLSRERIVDRMNTALPESDKPITLRQLNAWTAQSKEYHEFPARYLPAFCAATECDLPLRVLANGLQLELVDRRDLLTQQLGQNLIESARLKREARFVQRQLGA